MIKNLIISSVFFLCGCASLVAEAEDSDLLSMLIYESDVIVVGEFHRPVEMLAQEPGQSFYLFRVLVTDVIKNAPEKRDRQKYDLPIGEMVKVIYAVNEGDLPSSQLSIPKGDRFDGVFFLKRNFNQLEALNPWLYYVPRSQILEEELLRRMSACVEESMETSNAIKPEPAVSDPFERIQIKEGSGAQKSTGSLERVRRKI